MKSFGRITSVFIFSIICIYFLSGCSGFTALSEGNQDKNESRAFAKDFSRTAASTLAPVYAPLAEQIVADFGLIDKEGVGIDLGGGTGSLIVELAKRTRTMNWILADINPEVFPYAAKTADIEGVGHRIGMIAADAKVLPFRDNYADILVSRGSFQFWGDLNIAFSEVYRILKPGGIAYIGRGLSRNLPVETARIVRFGKDGKGGNSPKYDLDKTAETFETTLKKLGITDYIIHRPVPPGSEGINYGIWLEFHKQ
ncbi:class I SAM-dependent methyltransferase [Candidatus Latescibacterota bacterium]